MANKPTTIDEDCTCCDQFRKHVKTGSPNQIPSPRPWPIILGICLWCKEHWYNPDLAKGKWISVTAEEAAQIAESNRDACALLRGAQPSILSIVSDQPESSTTASVVDHLSVAS
jgi:hypothetical protein